MTTAVLNCLSLRAAMRSVDIADLPGIVARHKAEVDRLDAAELHEYIRCATGLTRVEADEQVRQW